MAHMFPRQIREDTKSDAERKVFEVFKNGLSDEFTVFHNVSWLGRMDSGKHYDGQADFIVAHSKLGVLVIEVKGGIISSDGPSGKWFTKNWFGQNIELNRSPFDQVIDSHHNLDRFLMISLITNQYTYKVIHAVCFPDGIATQDFGLSAPKELIIDGEKLKEPEKTITNIFKYWMPGGPGYEVPGEAGIKAMIELLAPQVEIRSLLSITFESEEQQIKKLTQQQFMTLDLLSRVNRALISGCAGSGKTLLALEKARRLANEGYAVLFVCFNTRLAEWIRTTPYNQPGITITNFHKLCTDWAQKAKLRIPGLEDEEAGGDEDFYFDSLLPNLLVDATQKKPANFNAIIVDEGQDFRESWWIALESMLVNPQENIYYIFADDNQNIYAGAEQKFPFTEPTITLTQNCRNTQQIHKIVREYYRGPVDIGCIGPEGQPPELLEIGSPTSVIDNVKGIIHRLTNSEKVPFSDIVILTPRSKKTSQLKDGLHLGNSTLVWEPKKAPGEIECCTIHSFKGLEKPVVILTEIADIPAKDREKLIYIGVSRARNYLIILGKL